MTSVAVPGTKNPAAGRRESGSGDGVLKSSSEVAGYLSLALTEMPTMRGSL